MKTAQLLKGKHALIFGAGGSFGSVVAREFAAEGAEVFLSGRSRSSVEDVATQVNADGGMAHAAVIDAEDPASVDAYIDDIATQAGSIDVVFNLIGPRLAEYGGGKPATQLSVDEFMAPLVRLVKLLRTSGYPVAVRWDGGDVVSVQLHVVEIAARPNSPLSAGGAASRAALCRRGPASAA